MTSLKLLNISNSICYRYLSLFVFLLAVSCDNESNKKPPALKGVNLSSRQTDEGVKQIIETGKAYVKLTMTTDKAGGTYAKYYKSTKDNGSDLKEAKFLIQTDGSIDEFFLQASEAGNEYWVQRFDIYDRDPDASSYKGTLQYSISEKKKFTLRTKDSDNNVIIDVVKNESEEAGISTSIKSPSFATKKVKGYSFIVGFQNSLQQWFKKSNDYKIVFKVKHGDNATKAEAVSDANADYINEDLFKDAEDDDNYMEITLPKSINYYKNKVFVIDATIKRSAAGSVEHTFDISGGGDADTKIREGEIHLKIKNNFPTIKVIGGDGTNAYSDSNKTFDLDNDHNIAIFVPSDKEDGKDEPLINTYKWTLYKEGVEVTDAWIHPSTSDRSLDSKLSLYNNPSIRPAGVMIAQNTTLASQTKSEISKYTLKGYAKADDGLGGITEKTVVFNFKKVSYVAIKDQNFLRYLKGILPANAFNSEGKLNTLCDEVKNLTKIEVPQKGIKSLQGIKYFTGLHYLDCQDNRLTKLNLSHNTALSYLDCSFNELNTLDVSYNTALTELDCYDNSLTTLDLSHNCKLNHLSTGLPNDKLKRCKP